MQLNLLYYLLIYLNILIGGFAPAAVDSKVLVRKARHSFGLCKAAKLVIVSFSSSAL